jgi:hypothetical protein
MHNEVKKGNAALNANSVLFAKVSGSVEEIGRNMEDVVTVSRSQGRSAMRLGAQLQSVNYVFQGTAERASDVAIACKNTSSSLFRVAQDIADVNLYARNVASGTRKNQE